MAVNRIYADIKELLHGAKSLVLDDEANAGEGTLTVKNITGAAINQILFLRQPGSESAEIVLTHASTAPSGSTVTLASNLTQNHGRGTRVFIIRADKVRFYHADTEVDANADDTDLTALAAAQAIDPTEVRNYYEDDTETAGFYYYRFENSLDADLNYPYSDPIPWGLYTTNFERNEAGYIMEKVRRRLKKQWSEDYTKQDALEDLSEGMRTIQGELKRWARALVPDYAIGYTARGVNDFSLPEDIYDDETLQSVLQVRLGGNDGARLAWRDEIEFDDIMGSTIRTTIRTQPTPGQTTLNIVNSFDLPESGTVNIYTGNTNEQITYTGVTRSATEGVLTGIPASGEGSITLAHLAGTNVWMNHIEGIPRYFNVRQGRLRIWPLPSSTYIDLGVYLDYYEEFATLDSESDTIDVVRYDMLYYWLMWKARAAWFKKGRAVIDDPDYILFRASLQTYKRITPSNQKFKMKPKVNRITY